MNDNPFNNRRPTELEDKAHVEAVRHFAEHMRQLATSRGALKQLDRTAANMALVTLAASQSAPLGNPILTHDGTQWHKGIDLFDDLSVCHRATGNGIEYAVIEHFPNGRNEIWNRGAEPVEVLKAFTHDEQQALQIWTEHVSARVKEFLAEKYPGRDMSRVADSFMHKFATQQISEHHALSRNHQQKQSHGIGI